MGKKITPASRQRTGASPKLDELVDRLLAALAIHDHSCTPEEFWKGEKIGRSTYFEMKKLGLGPRTYRPLPGSRIERISPEARREWRRQREAATASERAGSEAEPCASADQQITA